MFYNYISNRCSKKDYSVCNVKINDVNLRLTVAYSQKAQAKGLMYITKLEYGSGMIFVYDDPRLMSFWMKNTRVPLSIAYLDSEGRIAEIYEMAVPDSDDETRLPVYTSLYPSKYAVEVPAGWFALYGIKTGDRLDLPDTLK